MHISISLIIQKYDINHHQTSSVFWSITSTKRNVLIPLPSDSCSEWKFSTIIKKRLKRNTDSAGNLHSLPFIQNQKETAEVFFFRILYLLKVQDP